MPLGGVLNRPPGGERVFLATDVLQCVEAVPECLAALGIGLGVHACLHLGPVGVGMFGVGPCRENAQVEGVVGDRKEVQRPVELDVEAPGVFDGLALGEAIGMVRRGQRAEQECVERVARMDVQIPEECGLVLAESAGCDEYAGQAP